MRFIFMTRLVIIVEFIARHNLATQSDQPFSAKSIISVGEIGYPAENVKLFSRAIKDELNVKLWDGDEKNFAAVGDEEGLFIIVAVNRPWFPRRQKGPRIPGWRQDSRRLIFYLQYHRS